MENIILNEEKLSECLSYPVKLDKEKSLELTGYPHIDKPWMQYYSDEASNLTIIKKTIYENFCDVVKKYDY